MNFFRKIKIAILIFVSFISCNNSKVSNNNLVKVVSFDTTEAIERDELVLLSLSQNYKLNDEQIDHDLKSFLNAKNCENISDFNRSLLTAKSFCGSKRRYEIKKEKSFSKQFSRENEFINSKQLKIKSMSEEDSDNVIFSIYNYVDNKTGKNGFAITSNDERIGSLLCVIEDCEYSDNVDNPLLDIFLSHLDSYVENVSDEWESITEADYELFKQKYGITDEDIEKARLEYESSLKTKKFWGYGNWSEWSINDINLNNHISKTQWGQSSLYNDAIEAVYEKNYLTGCGATAVAQIMAYHRWPERYSNDLNFLKNKWSLAKNINWNGFYDWDAMTANPNINYLSSNGKICIGALMYEVAEGCKSKYGTQLQGGTSTTMDDRIKYLRNNGYYSDNSKNYSYASVSSSLHKNCPVMVRANDTKGGGGHAWIIDGSLELKRSRNYYAFWIPFPSDEYQSYVHCNFGWNGYDNEGNAYYYSGTGYYKSGVFATSSYDFSKNIKIATNIRPKR